jgi:hypothetical protein
MGAHAPAQACGRGRVRGYMRQSFFYLTVTFLEGGGRKAGPDSDLGCDGRCDALGAICHNRWYHWAGLVTESDTPCFCLAGGAVARDPVPTLLLSRLFLLKLMEIYRIDATEAGPPRQKLAWPLLDLEPGDAFDMPLRLGATWHHDRVEPTGHKVSYARTKAWNDGYRYGRVFRLRVNRAAATLTVIRVL